MKIPARLLLILISLTVAACRPNPTAILKPLPTATTPAIATVSPAETGTPTGTEKSTATPTEGATATPQPPTATATPAESPQNRQPGGEITIGLVGKLEGLNPLLDLDSTLAEISPLFTQSLMQIDPTTGATKPGLATELDISADGLTLTYTLNPGLVTAADVQASIEIAVWPELVDVRRVETPDAQTVVVTLTQPNCALADTLSRLPLFRAADVEAEAPQSTGPFAVENRAETELRLTANPDFDGPAPLLEAITIRLFESEAQAWAAIEAGEIDLVSLTTLPQAPPDGYRSTPYPGSEVTFVAFNNQEPPFDQLPVRQALSLAVDREALLQAVFGGEGTLLDGFLPPEHWAADPDLSLPDFDPEAAKALLDEAGFRDQNGDGWRDDPESGETWLVGIRADESRPAEIAPALSVAAAYRQVGVKAQAEIVTFDVLIDDLLTHDYQAALYRLAIPVDADLRPYWHSDQIEAEFGINLTAYRNSQVDAWLVEANRVPGCDIAERVSLNQEILAQLSRDRPFDLLIQPNRFLVARETLGGMEPGPFAPLTWNAGTWHRK